MNNPGKTLMINKNTKLKLDIYYCVNSININELSMYLPKDEGVEYKLISLPCSGRADLLYLIKSFEAGADGLVLMTCQKDECHYLEGNLRAPKRAHEVNALLEEIGMGMGRILVLSINKEKAGDIAPALAEFCSKISNII